MVKQARETGSRTRPVQAIAMIVISGFLALGAVELILRITLPDRYSVWAPGMDVMFYPDPDILPGVSGAARFTTNEFGIRGRSFSDEDTYRILAVGGSTTESVFMDDTETWSHVLEQHLNQRFPEASVWVGNVGKSGRTARDHALQVEKLPPQYPTIDAAIVLVGINDLLLRLRRADDYRPLTEESADYRQDLLLHAFESAPEFVQDYPIHKRTRTWQAFRKIGARFAGADAGPVQDPNAEYMVGQRELRRNGTPFVEEMPDLSTALADYRHTLNAIVTALEAQGIAPILATQPSMWRGDLPLELDALLSFGRDGRTSRTDRRYFSVAALEDGMMRHNEVLLDVCRTRSITCVDLASQLPKDGASFYDAVHFTEEGSRRVAAALAEALAADPALRTRLGVARN